MAPPDALVLERARAASAAADTDPARCADAVLDTVPALMDALRMAMRRHVGDQLSVPQFRCLNFVAHNPGCTIGAVAAFLGVTMPTASAMVDRLVRAGAVRAGTTASDRRRSLLQLTPAGRTQLRKIRQGAHDELRRAIAALPRHELQRLRDGLDVLRAAFLLGN
ncbi:MAG: MarR family winged helix-turn-helix transcriptional regulator [Burkholderiaceae bacterium]